MFKITEIYNTNRPILCRSRVKKYEKNRFKRKPSFTMSLFCPCVVVVLTVYFNVLSNVFCPCYVLCHIIEYCPGSLIVLLLHCHWFNILPLRLHIMWSHCIVRAEVIVFAVHVNHVVKVFPVLFAMLGHLSKSIYIEIKGGCWKLLQRINWH